MRDIIRHPISIEEVVSELLALADSINKESNIGDMRPLLLKVAAQTIEHHNKLFFDIDNLPLTKDERAGFKRKYQE